jgi:TfoX/Sxy family transcriptional regulator of competence genes
MSADDDVASRVRSALKGAGTIREVKMFGGIGFMLNGNFLVGASKRGLLVRVGKEGHQSALRRKGARTMEMRGQVMEGYVYVDPPALDDDALKTWLQTAMAFVRTLPVKSAKAKPKRKGKPK